MRIGKSIAYRACTAESVGSDLGRAFTRSGH